MILSPYIPDPKRLRQLPERLRRQVKSWTLCKLNGRIPIDLGGKARRGPWHDHADDFEVVCAALQNRDLPDRGLGFVFSSDRAFTGIDLDHVRNPESGEVVDWAKTVIERFGGYVEVSAGRDGFHLLLEGSKPDDFTECVLPGLRDFAGGTTAQIEVYDHGRYFVTTGDAISDSRTLAGTEALPWLRSTVGGASANACSNGLFRNDDLSASLNEGVPEGQRNTTAARLAGRLIREGFDETEVLAQLREWNMLNRPPLPELELNRVVRSILRCDERNGRHPPDQHVPPTDGSGQELRSSTWPDPRPLFRSKPTTEFPLDSAFPPALVWLRDYVRAVSVSLQVPGEAVAMLALAVASFAASKQIEVEPQKGWREPVPIWTLVLLPSGERKSAVFSELLRPVSAWIYERTEAMRFDIARHLNQIEVAKAKLNAARKKAAGDSAGAARSEELSSKLAIDLALLEANLPNPPSFLVTDATTEALAQVLGMNGERALVASPEADALDVLLGRYSESKANFGVWLKGHAGDSIHVHRRTREPDVLLRPALSVGLVVQPDAVRGLFADRDARGRGLLARFLPCAPQSWLGNRVLTPPPIDEALRSQWADTLRSLLDQGVPSEPTIVGLTPDAAEDFMGFRRWHETELSDDGAFADRRDWGSKLPGAMLRIAGVLTVLQGGSSEIDLSTMQSALSLTDFLLDHESYVSQLAGEDPVATVALKILRWIDRKSLEHFSARDAFSDNRGSYVKKAPDVEPALQLLEELGWIRSKSPPGRQGRGRPASAGYDVHPRLADFAKTAELDPAG